MRTIIAALAGVSLSGAALAAPQPPPERFDHAHPALIIVERDYRAVDPVCRQMFPRSKFPAATETHRITGCAEIGDGQRPCHIWVPRADEGVISAEHRAAIVRHETAHCNGWPSNHAR
jgi:hypothetical protein